LWVMTVGGDSPLILPVMEQGNLGVLVYTPPPHQKDAQTGDLTRPYKGLDVDDDEVILEPSDAPDFNWSPL